MKLIKSVLILALFTGTTTIFAQDAVPSSATTTTVPDSLSAVIGTPEAGKALVVFFRPKAFKGGGINFKVRENDVEMGRLRNGNYFTLQVAPGKHEYVVHAENKDVTTIEAEDGETYFISGEVNFGFMSGRPNLSPSDVDAFEAALPKLKKSKPIED